MGSNEYLTLGESFEEKGKYFKAERLYKKALNLKSREVEGDSKELIPYLYSLGMVQAALDRVSDATSTLSRLLSLLIRHEGEEHADVQEIRQVIRELHADIGALVANA